MYPSAVFQLIIAIGIRYNRISSCYHLTGMTFPIYIGAMIAAACIRNIGEYSGKFTIYMGEINDIGGISLSLFPWYRNDNIEAMAACRLGTAVNRTLLAGQSTAHLFIHVFCGI